MSEGTGSVEPLVSLPSVLVIGGNGFLGRRIPPLLKSRHPNCKISIVDIAPQGSLPYDYYQADITKLSSITETFNEVKPTVVIHSASPPIPTSGKGDPAFFFAVNVEGTRNVITACQESGVKGLVYTSSASVVYNGGDLINANETTPYATIHVDAYNASKVSVACFSIDNNRRRPINWCSSRILRHLPPARFVPPASLDQVIEPLSPGFTMLSVEVKHISKLEII